MQTVIPAHPGTYLLDSGGSEIAVIIGWAHVQGNRLDPLFDIARSGPLISEAIQHPGGYVSHPSSKLLFVDASAWESYATENKLDKVAAVVTKPVDAAVNKPVETVGKPSAALTFGTKSHKTKSFWHWPEMNAIFEIEGESPYPTDSRVTKIKRDEFAELKRQKLSVIDPHSGIIDEEPAVEAAEEDDDMDVV